MNLESLRKQIDQIDHEMMNLFKKRMNVSAQIGEYKKLNALPVFDEKREKELLDIRRIEFDNEKDWPLYEAFIKEMMRLSKVAQK